MNEQKDYDGCDEIQVEYRQIETAEGRHVSCLGGLMGGLLLLALVIVAIW